VTEEGKRAIWLSIMMGFFAVMWVFWATRSLSGQIALWTLGVAVVVSVLIALVVRAGARNIPEDSSSTPPNWKVFWGWVAFEIVAAVVGLSLLNQFGQYRFDMPVLALIVGIHFFGMGAAFHKRLHHLVGAAMCLVALLSSIWLPPAGAETVSICDLVVGLGCAEILWSFVLITAFGPARN
jgi:small-conductance mechanosensitive channel